MGGFGAGGGAGEETWVVEFDDIVRNNISSFKQRIFVVHPHLKCMLLVMIELHAAATTFDHVVRIVAFSCIRSQLTLVTPTFFISMMTGCLKYPCISIST